MKTKSRKMIERKIDKITDVINRCKYVSPKDLSLHFFDDGGMAIKSKDFTVIYVMENDWYTCKTKFHNGVNDDVLRELSSISVPIIKILYADAAAFLSALSDAMEDEDDEEIIEDKRKIN